MKAGDIALSPLMQADGQIKTRPVLLLRQAPPFGDFIACGISTQLHPVLFITVGVLLLLAQLLPLPPE